MSQLAGADIAYLMGRAREAVADDLSSIFSRLEDLEAKEKALQDWDRRARRDRFAAAALPVAMEWARGVAVAGGATVDPATAAAFAAECADALLSELDKEPG